MNSQESPTPWQRRTIWRALTSLAIAAIFSVAVGFIYVFSQVMAFLQPILVPFAIAGVLAYLLDPLVVQLVRLGTTRARAVIAVFAVTTLTFVGFMFWIIPVISAQTEKLAGNLPEITYRVRLGVANFAKKVRDSYGVKLVPDEFLVVPKPKPKKVPGAVKIVPPSPAEAVAAATPGTPTSPSAIESGKTPETVFPPLLGLPDSPVLPGTTASAPAIAPLPPGTPTVRAPDASPIEIVPTPGATPAATGKTAVVTPAAGTPDPGEGPIEKLTSGDWIQDAMPAMWRFISVSLGGFLGFFGFLLSLVIVPLYLFYFLAESEHIARNWSKYLPLRSSSFKDEVVESLTEINGYLIAFFRGQLVVSMINGVATGLLLVVAGLDFGILIGFALCFMGIIPYLGIVLCWIPAVVIASVQGGSWIVASDAAWWVFPVIVTGIFAVVQQIDGLFITPRIVGERVGLHPVTVIFSVFLWSLLLGGLLGAILAVPMTATLKVILKRYVWDRTIMADPALAVPPAISDK